MNSEVLSQIEKAAELKEANAINDNEASEGNLLASRSAHDHSYRKYNFRNQADCIEGLDKLDELKKKGILTEEDYDKKKREMLQTV